MTQGRFFKTLYRFIHKLGSKQGRFNFHNPWVLQIHNRLSQSWDAFTQDTTPKKNRTCQLIQSQNRNSLTQAVVKFRRHIIMSICMHLSFTTFSLVPHLHERRFASASSTFGKQRGPHVMGWSKSGVVSLKLMGGITSCCNQLCHRNYGPVPKRCV